MIESSMETHPEQHDRYRCMTIHQTWAEEIIAGTKVIENRSWAVAYRGLLLIHAGRGRVVPGYPIGVLLGAVELVDMLQGSRLPGAEPGFTHWELRRPVRFSEPIPCRGRQGVWFLPDELQATVARELAGSPLGR